MSDTCPTCSRKMQWITATDGAKQTLMCGWCGDHGFAPHNLTRRRERVLAIVGDAHWLDCNDYGCSLNRDVLLSELARTWAIEDAALAVEADDAERQAAALPEQPHRRKVLDALRTALGKERP